MKIEVLYVSQCPSHPAAVKLVKDVLAAAGVATEDVHEVLIRDKRMASELKFIGSPTIRINGRDVAGDAQTGNFALSCRLYPGSKRIGLPPEEMVHRAVLEARHGEMR